MSHPTTIWFFNRFQETYHEVSTDTDLERRMRRETTEVSENVFELTFRIVPEAEATADPESQPGYIAPSDS